MESVAKMVGIAGHVKDVEFPLEYGKKVIVGRSRSADWSLVRLESWKSLSQEEQEKDHSFRTISGKHFEITMFNLGSIELANLSSNGTQLDGRPLDRETITDLSSNSHEIAFGADEVVRLELVSGSDAGGEAAEALDETLEKIDGDDDPAEQEEKDSGSADPANEKADEEKKEE